MREFRTGYFAAPHQTDRSGEPGNIATRVDVAVSPASTRTGKAMLDQFSNFPAGTTRLRRVSGVDITHAQANPLRFVGDKVLQLTKGPSVQPRPDPLSGLDVGADVGQVFHTDFAGSDSSRFRNDGFAGLVVYVFDMPLFAPGDNLKFALCSAATVGLETPAIGKVFVAVVPQFSAAPDLSRTGCREIIFTNINPANAAASFWRGIGKIEDKIEVPNALADYQLCFLGRAARKQVALMFAANEWNLGAAGQGEQREHIGFDRVGAFVKVDRRRPEGDRRYRLVLRNPVNSLERLIGVRNTVNRLADHLAAKRWELVSDAVVGQVVQGNTVPTPMFLGDRGDGVTCRSVSIRKRRQCRHMFRRGDQLEGYSSLHIGQVSQPKPVCQNKNGHQKRSANR